YPASSSSERVSFRQINKKTGNRLKQQLVDSVTGEIVEGNDKGRGYEVGRNQYILVEDEELESLRRESTHTIDIIKFVPRAEVDELYSTALITSPQITRLGRKPLPSFGRRWRKSKWSACGAW